MKDKKFIILLTICFLVVTICSGCNTKKQEKSTIGTTNYYFINSNEDKTIEDAKRIDLYVYFDRTKKEPTSANLKKCVQEIVKKYDDYKGIKVYFYDVFEEARPSLTTPMAAGVWAPKGDFREAIYYEKYSPSDYSIIITKNKENFIITDEQRAIYNEYLKIRENCETVDDIVQKLNIPDDEIDEMLDLLTFKMPDRYEQQ